MKAGTWESWSLNKSYLNDLRKKFGNDEFNLEQAYQVYHKRTPYYKGWQKYASMLRKMSDEEWVRNPVTWEKISGRPFRIVPAPWLTTRQPMMTRKETLKHAVGRQLRGDYYWSNMNARNTLAKAAHEGILIRVRRGVYKFR